MRSGSWRIKHNLSRETIEDLKDIERLQRIERFHKSQIEEEKSILERLSPDHNQFELIKGHGRTPKEVMINIEDHIEALRRVSYRIAELTILEE